METRIDAVINGIPFALILRALILPPTSKLYWGELQEIPTLPLVFIRKASIIVLGGLPFIGHTPLFEAIST